MHRVDTDLLFNAAAFLAAVLFLAFLPGWPSAVAFVAALASLGHRRHGLRTRATVDEDVAARIKALEEWREVVKNRPGMAPK